VVISIFIIERMWLSNVIYTKQVTYEKIENIKPEMRPELIEDLKERTGLDIVDVEIGNIDFLKDATKLTVKYKK
jgi:hypothetical protein